MGEIGIHYDNVVTAAELQAVDIGCTKTELTCARFEQDMGGVCFCELVCNDLCSVGGAVVDDYKLPVEVSARCRVSLAARIWGNGEGNWECDPEGRRTAR